jgi:DNA repair protein RadC
MTSDGPSEGRIDRRRRRTGLAGARRPDREAFDRPEARIDAVLAGRSAPPAPHDRPREKLVRLGVAGLGDNELLAAVIGSGSRGRPALDLANAVLSACGGVHGLTRVSHDDLRRVRGVGMARAAQMLAAVELGRRTLRRPGAEREPLTSPADVAALLLPQFGAHRVEHFGIVLLDTRHRVLRTTLLTVGSADCSVVHPRDVFREAANAAAAAIVLFHNHPSGDPTPSREDAQLTRRLVMAGEIMGVPVLDHLVLADSRYYSFREAGNWPA